MIFGWDEEIGEGYTGGIPGDRTPYGASRAEPLFLFFAAAIDK